jgi:hypothetical protein
MAESPAGSIIAYAGENLDSNWENLTGWMHCDGRPLSTNSYPGLFAAIQFTWGGDPNRGIFNIPDLRGYFLRGVDTGRRDPPTLAVDKGSDARFAVNDLPGGKLEERSAARPIGNRVGSYQPFATARPQGDPRIGEHNYFKTRDRTDGLASHAMMGVHLHKVRFQLNASRDVNGTDNTVAFPGGATDEPFMEDDGAHRHDITEGGDLETRPVNAAIHWIICFK